VLGLVRSHELAQEFRTKALRLPKPKESGGLPIALIGGLIALLALASAATLVALRRRGRGSDGTPAEPPQPPRPPRPAVATVAANGSDPPPALLGTSGPLAGRRISAASPLVLGRGAVDVRLDDPTVSAVHASVQPVDGGLEIVDLGSANGTLVNGRLIDGPVLLVHGDVLQLGGTILRVELGQGVDWRRDTLTGATV
jgi:FHA domain